MAVEETDRVLIVTGRDGLSVPASLKRAAGALLAVAPRVLSFLRATPEAAELRLPGGMRLLLAVTVLGVTASAPPVNSRSTYGVLGFYIAYAAAVHLVPRVWHAVPATLQSSAPLIDIAIFAVLVALNGWSSFYLVLFLFGLLVASFRWLAVGPATIVSLALFVIVGYLSHASGTIFDFDHAIVSAAVVGYMIVFRGTYERRLRRRLRLLRDIATLSNPRLGPNRMLARSLECLREFYDADFCLGVLVTPDSHEYELRRAIRDRPDAAHDAEALQSPIAGVLLGHGDDVVSFRGGVNGAAELSRPEGGRPEVAVDQPRYQAIAELLGVAAYLTVPLRTRTKTAGRLYVGTSGRGFDHTDAELLLQAADKIMPHLGHITLVERMATRAAEEERHRLALDIHDRLIQPYVGLQIGIGAVRQLVSQYPDGAVPAAVRKSIAGLADLSETGIQELRGYTRGLRGASSSGGLAESLRRFSDRFHEATGIEVTVEFQSEISVGDYLSAEIFSMACEAVSNVRRHTDAHSASITLRQDGRRVVLRVENPVRPHSRAGTFVPRSITERAAGIDGTVSVDVTQEGLTAVVVEIPL